MGSELLFDPWQPHAMILPFWAFLIVVWALAAGHLAMAPIAVGLASLIVQTHLSFVYTIIFVSVAATGLAVWSVRHAGPAAPQWRRPLLASALVLVLAWIQPFLDQVAGEGNLFALLETRGSDASPTYELGASLRVVASIVALPPWWGRSGFGTSDITSADVTNAQSSSGATIGLAIVVALLGAVVVAGLRRRSRATVTIGTLAVVAVVAAIVSMTLSPIGVVGFSLHQLRWLWPISAFVLAAILFGISEWRPARQPAKVLLLGATAALSVMALPRHITNQGPAVNADHQSVVVDLLEQIETYRPGQRVVFDTTRLRYNEPYSGPIIAELARAGVDVVSTDEGMIRQLGNGRRADGSEQAQIYLVEGSAAEATPAGSIRLAFVPGLEGPDDVEWSRLSVSVVDDVTERGVRLNDAGLAAAASGLTTFGEVVVERGSDASGLADEGWLAILINEGWIDVPADLAADWSRYAELEARRQQFTVGLFEAPVER